MKAVQQVCWQPAIETRIGRIRAHREVHVHGAILLEHGQEGGGEGLGGRAHAKEGSLPHREIVLDVAEAEACDTQHHTRASSCPSARTAPTQSSRRSITKSLKFVAHTSGENTTVASHHRRGEPDSRRASHKLLDEAAQL